VAAGRQRSADSDALRWRRSCSCRARDACIWAPARGVAHGVAAASWSGGGGWSAAVGNSAAAVATGTLSEHTSGAVGTVALGRAGRQLGACTVLFF
jgi:hypothetical protein